jgi:hypothetical protein
MTVKILSISAVVIILIHGLIHLMGFLKAWNLAEINQLTGKTLFPISESLNKLLGIVWLIVCLFFSAAAVLLLTHIGLWWIIASVGVALSQMLIVIYWKDAFAGTVANILIVVSMIILKNLTS